MTKTITPHRYINLNGISFHLSGDMEEAYKLHYKARTIMDRLNAMNVNELEQMWHSFKFDDGSFIRVRNLFGKQEADIYVPPKLPKPPKEEIEVKEKDFWRFVPGIAIKDIDLSTVSYSYPNDPYTTGHMSVCADGEWGGVFIRIINDEEQTYPRDPGEKYIDLIGALVVNSANKYEQTDIFACTNWGKTDWYFQNHTTETIDLNYVDTDTGWVPGPYGYYPGNYYNIINYMIATLGDVYYQWSFGTHTSEMQAWIDDCISWGASEDCWGCYSPFNFCWNTDSQSDPVSCTFPLVCYQNFVSNTVLQTAVVLNGGLWDGVRVRAGYETGSQTCDTPCYLVCGCHDDLWIFHDLGMQLDSTLGGPQTRSRYNRSLWVSDFVSHGVTLREDVSFSFDFQTDTINHSSYAITGLCSREQVDTYTYRNLRAKDVGFMGGYIQSDCPLDEFIDLYFVVYEEDTTTQDKIKTDNEVNFDEAWDWDGTGAWNDGRPDVIPGPWQSSEETSSCELCVYFNGERIVIDSAVDDIAGEVYWGFRVLDSYIFNAMGTPVYMYGYVKYKTTYDSEGNGIEDAVYTKYGYFAGDSEHHYQSQEFYPAGIMNTVFPEDYGITNLHDVYGSADLDTPLYGWGQCCGFMINERTKQIYELPR